MSKLTSGVICHETYSKKYGDKKLSAFVEGDKSKLKIKSINIDKKEITHYLLDDNGNCYIDGDELAQNSFIANSFKAYADDELIIEW